MKNAARDHLSLTNTIVRDTGPEIAGQTMMVLCGICSTCWNLISILFDLIAFGIDRCGKVFYPLIIRTVSNQDCFIFEKNIFVLFQTHTFLALCNSSR